jgi:uroporphyrinogen decarboxylase
MSSKKELVLKAFHNEETERIPVGFWHHYLTAGFNDALQNPALYEENLAGARKFKEEFDPDFVKVMTDGFFFLPFDFSDIHTVKDLKKLQSIPEDHPWFEANVRLIKDVRAIYGDDILIFYNVFAPLTQLRDGVRFANLSEEGFGEDLVLKFLKEDPQTVQGALQLIARNIEVLIRKVVGEGLADGIYLSVSNPNRQIPADVYTTYIAPSEKQILAQAKELSEDHILHICGYQGNKNILSVYQDYDASVINWAVHAEEFGLAEGKKYFGGKAVLGGFDNTTESVLYKGTKEEVEAYVETILKEVGKTGVIIGADCTVPTDIDPARLKWVREKAAALSAS